MGQNVTKETDCILGRRYVYIQINGDYKVLSTKDSCKDIEEKHRVIYDEDLYKIEVGDFGTINLDISILKKLNIIDDNNFLNSDYNIDVLTGNLKKLDEIYNYFFKEENSHLPLTNTPIFSSLGQTSLLNNNFTLDGSIVGYNLEENERNIINETNYKLYYNKRYKTGILLEDEGYHEKYFPEIEFVKSFYIKNEDIDKIKVNILDYIFKSKYEVQKYIELCLSALNKDKINIKYIRKYIEDNYDITNMEEDTFDIDDLLTEILEYFDIDKSDANVILPKLKYVLKSVDVSDYGLLKKEDIRLLYERHEKKIVNFDMDNIKDRRVKEIYEPKVKTI